VEVLQHGVVVDPEDAVVVLHRRGLVELQHARQHRDTASRAADAQPGTLPEEEEEEKEEEEEEEEEEREEDRER
jgi:hypothetical protein